MISEGSWDTISQFNTVLHWKKHCINNGDSTEDCSNDAENSALRHRKQMIS